MGLLYWMFCSSRLLLVLAAGLFPFGEVFLKSLCYSSSKPCTHSNTLSHTIFSLHYCLFYYTVSPRMLRELLTLALLGLTIPLSWACPSITASTRVQSLTPTAPPGQTDRLVFCHFLWWTERIKCIRIPKTLLIDVHSRLESPVPAKVPPTMTMTWNVPKTQE